MLYLDAPSFSVSQLVRYLKEALDSDPILQNIWVRGEVSGSRLYAASGHCYFTLKDADTQLSCVFFKGARLLSAAPELRDGMEIAANGRISLYERDGKLQLYVERVENVGSGALHTRFEQLKTRLEAEGLFDEARKRPLPDYPSVIGVVTSPQAAALQDILRTLQSRYPLARAILSPATVQGEEAPLSIANALDLLNQHGEAEVIIVGRGGGSIEDLWAFNEEVVARAIARSRIPVISGVGHETDFTIADFVADYRASTPTAAAVAAVPNIETWYERIATHRDDLGSFIEDSIQEKRDSLEEARRDLARFSPQSQLESLYQRLDNATALLQERMDNLLNRHRDWLRSVEQLLDSLSPKQTVARGYAIVRRSADQRVVTSAGQVQTGEALTIQVADGDIQTIVQSMRPPS
jgi:exodeoxyribonuclease VII large subunit